MELIAATASALGEWRRGVAYGLLHGETCPGAHGRAAAGERYDSLDPEGLPEAPLDGCLLHPGRTSKSMIIELLVQDAGCLQRRSEDFDRNHAVDLAADEEHRDRDRVRELRERCQTA